MGRTILKGVSMIRQVEVSEDSMVKVTDLVFGEDITTIESYEEFCVKELLEDMDLDNSILGGERVIELLDVLDMQVVEETEENKGLFMGTVISMCGNIHNSEGLALCDINQLVFDYVAGKSTVNIGALA